MATSISITGTSTNTPTTVASAAPELRPNKAIATATASSKKLLAPIIAPGAAILWGNFHTLAQRYATKNIKNVCIVSGLLLMLYVVDYLLFFDLGKQIILLMLIINQL